MRDEKIDETLAKVGDSLLDKGAGFSVGKLVAELEGRGTNNKTDPYYVRDEHFLMDLQEIDEWRDEPRDPKELESLLDLFAKYWKEYPSLRFCQIVCNAHAAENGMTGFEEYDSPYADPLDELTDEQLQKYLERKVKKMEEEE